MTTSEFLKIITSIPNKRISGAEENVKIKFALPLLKFLGYDIITDVRFEWLRADIVVVDEKSNSKKLFILETKKWGEPIRNHLGQCLEYTLKHHIPLVMITSGDTTGRSPGP